MTSESVYIVVANKVYIWVGKHSHANDKKEAFPRANAIVSQVSRAIYFMYEFMQIQSIKCILN